MNKNKAAKLISEDLNNIERIERKQIENISEACSKLIQQCSKKELKVVDLKWQPHYSTVFKQLKSQLESILSSDTSKTLDKLNTIPYLLTLKNEIFSLLNSFSKFVIANGSLIGTKDSTQRKNFFIKIVHFQFLCHEIQAYFSGGTYSPTKFKISKIPARTWWEKCFGEITFVDLDTFVNKFKEEYQFVNQAEILSFKNSINFTSTNFTTTFEFDLFTRLYSPWEKIHQAWRIIYYHPGYLHFSTYGDTKDILSHYLDKPGTYVFRVSCKDLGFWTIGYVKGSKDMGQIKVDKTNLIEALVEGHKKNMYMYPNGELVNPDLSNLNEFRKEIVVQNEELQLYDCFEDYKECKICREGEKDLQLENCGHQICHACYKLLRKYDKKLCPFCNQKISSTTKVINIQNPSIYVDHNPIKSTVTTGNDFLYADMSSEHIEDAGPSDNDGTIPSRSNALKRNMITSIYSNVSDESLVNDIPTLPRPDAPPRPPRDKSVFLNNELDKPEINYPLSQNIKKFDLKASSATVTPKTDLCPPSPVYAEMVSPVTVNEQPKVQVDDLYSDVNEQDCVDSSSDVDNSICSNYVAKTNTNSLEHGITTSTSTHQTKSIDYSTLSDDVYYNPLEYEPNTSTQPTSVTVTEHNGLSHPGMDNDDIYCSPINMQIDACVYTLPVTHEVKQATNTVIQKPITNFITNNGDFAFDPSDDVYSNFDDINVEGVVCAKVDPFFGNWNDRDIARALRVARNDRQLAKDILVEFVNSNQ